MFQYVGKILDYRKGNCLEGPVFDRCPLLLKDDMQVVLGVAASQATDADSM